MPAPRASDIDLHWLWDDRCAACHGHAGDFTRKFLNVSGGELQGPHHVNDLRRFLHNHYLAGNEVEAIYNMLLAQAINQARFKGSALVAMTPPPGLCAIRWSFATVCSTAATLDARSAIPLSTIGN
jgi:hypothetical protein